VSATQSRTLLLRHTQQDLTAWVCFIDENRKVEEVRAVMKIRVEDLLSDLPRDDAVDAVWMPWIRSWQMLADHGVGPLAGAFVKLGGLCPKCEKFPAGGGSDGEFSRVCFHCWDSRAHTEPRCPICNGVIAVDGASIRLLASSAV
jgi:hypothetical protein